MPAIRRILFPTDFSEHAEYAWPYALHFGREFAAEVHLLHVVVPPPRLAEAYAVNFDPDQMVQALTAEAATQLDRQVEAAKEQGLIFHREIRVGVDAREILDYAAKHEIDLIVMATHGRSGLAHVLLGSVAEKVVRKAPCPVLTIKPPAMKSAVH
jgi:nucleotide-binding universal stress UspA family protein